MLMKKTVLFALSTALCALLSPASSRAQYAQQTFSQPQAQAPVAPASQPAPAALQKQPPQRKPGDTTQYSSVLQDIPLMNGMTEQPKQKDAHTPADGQPLETTADVPGNDKQVISYYHQALTKAGWKAADPTLHTYTKDGQTMILNTNFAGGHTTVRFQMVPSAQAAPLAPAQSGGVKYNAPAKGALTAQPMRN